MALVINILVEEELNLERDLSVQAILDIPVFDSLNLLAELERDNVPYVVLALNTNKLYTSIHSLPFFSSFCEIDDAFYGTTEDGIVLLSGDTDDGNDIHTGIIWKQTSLGSSHQKKIRKLLINGDLTSARAELSTEGITGDYTSNNKGVVAVGRNLIGRKWTMKIADFETLESIEIFPVVRSR